MADSRLYYDNKILAILNILDPTREQTADYKRAYDAINSLRDNIPRDERPHKPAFFKFLEEQTTASLKQDASSPAVAEQNRRLQVREKLQQYDETGNPIPIPVPVVDSDEQHDVSAPKSPKLVTIDEQLFAFLCLNAASLIPKELERITETFYSDDKMTVEDANWRLAQVIYARYLKAPNNPLLQKLIIGYLSNCVDDAAITAEITSLEKELFGISIKDFVVYRMTDSALVNANLAPNKRDERRAQPARSYDRITFGDELEFLLKASREKKPIITQTEYDGSVSAVRPIQTVTPAPEQYDDAFVAQCKEWVVALNEQYHSLEHDDEKVQLAKFVRDVNDYHDQVRQLSALHAKDGKFAPAEEAAKLRVKAQELRDRALGTDSQPGLFYGGKPTSGWKLFFGIALLILGAGLIAAGIAALWCPPAAAFIMSVGAGVITSAAILSDMAIGACVIGGASVLGGGFSIFAGAGRRPATVLTKTKKVINFCETAGLQSCVKEVKDTKAADTNLQGEQNLVFVV